MLYWGFDLGDGESTVARVEGRGGVPEIVEIDGKKVVLTAWAVMKSGEVRIGENAARSASSAIRSAARFKSRFLDPKQDSSGLLRDFSAKIFETLRKSGALKGGETGNAFYIGCPAGWDKAARESYQEIFENLGVPAARVISESRAVLVGAIQSNSLRDYVDLQSKSVLVVDIGSSTTDFAFISKGKEREIRTGGEVALGGGIMDELLLEACVAASPDAKALREVFRESESWYVDCELHARALKERYFSADAEYWASRRCEESLLITYDKPLVLDLALDGQRARRLTDQPCAQLGGLSFREAFCKALRDVSRSVEEDQPELLFLTGGVSRMQAVADWCREVFPEAVIYADSEPEFSVARGLAWCGCVDDELGRFRAEVDELLRSTLVEDIVSEHLPALYQALLDRLLDPILDRAVKPVLVEWREGRIDTIAEIAPALQARIRDYLYSIEAKELLLEPVRDWLQSVSTELNGHTSSICRRYHVPDQALVISTHLTASDFREVLESIKGEDMLPGQALFGAAVFVESVITVIIGMLCGGAGVALLVEGPLGVLIGIISSAVMFAVAHILGKKALNEHIENARLPLFLREMAISKPLPKLETGLKLPNPLKLFSADKAGNTEEAGSEEEKLRFRLLPQLVWADDDAVSAYRIQKIRARIRSGYEARLRDQDSAELAELNAQLCREVSDQIEKRLKTLAEQVEIPL